MLTPFRARLRGLPLRRKAFGAMALSMFCLSVTALVARKLNFWLPPLQTAALHNLVILVIFGAGALKDRPAPPKAWGLYWLRGLVGVTSMASMFCALSYMPVQTVLAFALLTPALSALAAAYALGERANIYQMSALAAGLAGALLAAEPWKGALAPDPRGSALMLLSAGCAAVAGVLIKRASERDGPRTTVTVSSLFAAFLILPVSLAAGWRPVPLEAYPLLVLVGFASAGGQYFLALALSLEKINALVSLDFLRLLFGSLMAWAWLGETPGGWSAVGGAVIAASTVWAYRAGDREAAERAA